MTNAPESPESRENWTQGHLIPLEPSACILGHSSASKAANTAISSPLFAQARKSTAFLSVSNPDEKKAHRAFLHDWALPYFLAKRGEPCTLIQCNPADLAEVGDLPGVVVRPDPYVQRRTFYLAKVDSEEISA
jgi:hypothetical protein